MKLVELEMTQNHYDGLLVNNIRPLRLAHPPEGLLCTVIIKVVLCHLIFPVAGNP